MALKHVKKYYNDVSNLYFSFLNNIKEVDKEIKENKREFDSETYNQLLQTIQEVKTNYDRLNYILYLFNLPARKSKQDKLSRNKNSKKYLSYFRENNSDEESILKECEENIKKFKELVGKKDE